MSKIFSKKVWYSQFLFLILTLSFSLSIFSDPSFSESKDLQNNTSTPSQSLQNNKLSAEEENIDSFNVNPKSGRWDTSDSLTDDYIIDSNLRLINSNNDSSTTSEYIAQRGLTKSDSKYEYRYKNEYDGDNTSEYSRDELGNSWDYESDDDNWDTGYSGAIISQSNGNLIVSRTGVDTNWGVQYTPSVSISTKVYNTLELRVKANSGVSASNFLIFGFISLNGTDDIALIKTDLSTEWTTISFDLTTDADWEGNPLVTSIRIYISDVGDPVGGDRSFSFDYIKLIGNYDYATHDNQGPSSTWDWDNSLEYFYDDLGNVSDFNDGTTENWTLDIGDTINNLDSEFLNITDAAGVITQIARTGLSISASGASGFDFFTMEFNASLNVTNIAISDGTNEVCTDSTGWILSNFHLFICDLDLDADWTGTETDLTISFIHANAATEIHINMMYLYDTSFGDKEGWTAYTTEGTHAHTYVDPEGFLKGRKLDDLGAGDGAIKQLSLNMDSSKFDSLVIRAKATFSSTIQVYDGGLNYLDNNMALTTSWTIFTIDLSDVGNWDGIETGFQFRDASSGNPTEYFFDYILLLKSENETQQDVFTIGLYDQNTANDRPLMNVTQHFWNNTYFQWRVYLMDSSSNIVSYFYSDNQTYSDVYFRAKVTYNVLTSNFKAEVKTDGESRIFKADYPDDFTNNGSIPQLFVHEKAPDIFFSSYLGEEFTASEVWIDYIEAPFKEAEWKNILNTGTHDNVTLNRPFAYTAGSCTGACFNRAFWSLNIPYLDAFSGSVMINSSDNDLLDTNDNVKYQFNVYNAERTTGDLEQILFVYIQLAVFAGNTNVAVFVLDFLNSETLVDKTWILTSSADEIVPSMLFSATLAEDRSIMDFNIKYTYDTNNFDTIYEEGQFNISLSSLSDASQEFIYESQYEITELNDQWIYINLKEFSFLERAIFDDFGTFDLTVQLTGILFLIFEFLKVLIRWASIAITQALFPFLIAIEVAVKALGPIFDASLVVLGNTIDASLAVFSAAIIVSIDALAPLIDGLEGLLGDLIDDVIALANTIWTGFISVIGDILDAIVPIIGQFINDVVDDLLPFVFAIWDAIVKAILNGIDPSQGLYDGVVNIISSVSDAVTSILALFAFIGQPIIFAWLIIFAVAFVFTFSAIQNQDPRTGRININGYVNSMTQTGMINVNRNHVFGFTVFIPVILILYVIVKILIAEGTFPDIFGNLPI